MPFSELRDLRSLLKDNSDLLEWETLTEIPCAGMNLPVIAISLKTSAPKDAPVLAINGSVHGLERIGSEVILAFLRTMLSYLRWDQVTQDLVNRFRWVCVPILNPSGVYLGTRSNRNGIDLMRNAPVDIIDPTSKWKIYQGHRISRHLPWYRGKTPGVMEPELQALTQFYTKSVFGSPFALSLDVHSGFGSVDRIWYPYARTAKPFPHEKQATALKKLLDQCLPNHVYVYEPQAKQYLTHGDFWDYFYDLYQKEQPNGVYLPLTLEMGSWNWIKKDPLNILDRKGLYHPMKPHRLRRILRRHWALLDFLTRAVAGHSHWSK